MIFTVDYPNVGPITVLTGEDYYEFQFQDKVIYPYPIYTRRFIPNDTTYMVLGFDWNNWDGVQGHTCDGFGIVRDVFSKVEDDATAEWTSYENKDGTVTETTYQMTTIAPNVYTSPNGIQYRKEGIQASTSSTVIPISTYNIENTFLEVRDLDPGILVDLIFNAVANYDPYSGIGDNDVEGGGGVFDDSSVDIDFPPKPNISVVDSGFVTIFTPTLQQMKDLSDYLWSPAFDISQVKKLFANPMDAILGVSILPVEIDSSSTKTVKVGGVSTGLTMNLADEQFVDVNFGNLKIETGTGGSYLDYSPYTKASIFLPYIGWRDIDIDDIMNKRLKLKYMVDIVSGGCVAWLKCDGSVLYEWTGQCAVNVPLTSVDFTNTITSAISAAGHIGSAISGAVTGVAGGGALGSVPGAIVGGVSGAMNGLAGLASDALNAKPTFPRSGSLGGPAGVMGHQQAYICLHRPEMAKPKHQKHFVGYPAYITRTVSQLVGTGFTSFSEIILEDLGLLDTEVAELSTILKGGVYL